MIPCGTVPVFCLFISSHRMERMTERSEGNERNEGGKKMHKFVKYWNCSAWNHFLTTIAEHPVFYKPWRIHPWICPGKAKHRRIFLNSIINHY